MIKTLFVNGCSWTEGHMLHLDSEVNKLVSEQGYVINDIFSVVKDDVEIWYPYKEIYNQYNWAGVVARELDIPNIVNYAIGAASNDRILRTTVDYVKRLTEQEKQETFIIIGWTIPDRSELYLNDKQGKAEWCSWNATQQFSTIDRIHNDEFTKRIDKFWELYVVDVFDHHPCVQKFFQQSYLLANLLEHHNIKYYFFNSFSPLFGVQDYAPFLEHFKHDIDTYATQTIAMPLNTDFFNFIGDKDELCLPDRHPNKLGHAKWAGHLLDDMRQQNII
jgi:hypothetical protein